MEPEFDISKPMPLAEPRPTSLQYLLTERVQRLMAEEIATWDAAKLRAHATDDTAQLGALVVERVLARSPFPSDRRMRMRLAGRQRLNALVEQHGGWVDGDTIAELLGVAPASVQRRVKRNGLLGIWDQPRGGRLRLPALQLLDDGRAVPGLKEVLDALDEGTSDEQKLLFMLGGEASLGGASPLHALRDGVDVDRIVELARSHLEQMAQ